MVAGMAGAKRSATMGRHNLGRSVPDRAPLPLQTIPPSGSQATFGPFAPVPLPAGKRYLLIAQATCLDDRANIDPATNSPCSQKPTALIDLVANDNNLGLRVLQTLSTIRRAYPYVGHSACGVPFHAVERRK